MSTRRTYEAVTRGLNNAGKEAAYVEGMQQHVATCEAVANELAKDSPRFDRERFLRDAGAKS